MNGIAARLTSAGQTLISAGQTIKGAFSQPLNTQQALNYVHLTFETAENRLDRAHDRAARSQAAAFEASQKAISTSTSSSQPPVFGVACESSTASKVDQRAMDSLDAKGSSSPKPPSDLENQGGSSSSFGVASNFLAGGTTAGDDAEAKVTRTLHRGWISAEAPVCGGRRQSAPASFPHVEDIDSEDEVSGDIGDASLSNQVNAVEVAVEQDEQAPVHAPKDLQHLEAAARYQDDKGVPEHGGPKLRLVNMAFELKQLLGLGFLTLPGGEAIERFRESNVVDASLKAVYLGIPSVVQLAFQAISGLAFNVIVLAVVDGARGLLSVAKWAGACAKGYAVKARDRLKGALPSCCSKASSPKEVSASPKVSSKSSKKSSAGLFSRGFNAVKQAGSSAASWVGTGAKWVKDFFTWPRSHAQVN
ncbi:MAG: hypothetical protein ACOYKZ_00500 [Chlamydiia bacterium]